MHSRSFTNAVRVAAKKNQERVMADMEGAFVIVQVPLTQLLVQHRQCRPNRKAC